jgi:LPS sulfotransferase NodH
MPRAGLVPIRDYMSETESKTRAVVICAGRRTGSTLLADGLRSTGRVGRPNEYFDVHQGNRNFWINRLAIHDDSEFFEKVVAAGTTPNGVFCTKLMWYQISSLVYFYNLAHGVNPPASQQKKFHRILNERFGRTDLIWLRRRDKVAQGISDYRALRTEVWRVRRGEEETKSKAKIDIPFEFAGIDQQVKFAENTDRHWQEYFIAHNLRATVVVYEDFIENYEPTIRAICRILGLDTPGPLVVGPQVWERQADDVSRDWKQEYLQIKQRQAAMQSSQIAVPAAADKPEPSHAAPSDGKSNPEPAVPDHADQTSLLIAYDINSRYDTKLVPASARRGWMDATSQHFANRCLPLIIANQHGWMLTTPYRIEATWNGGGMTSDLSIIYPPGESRKFAGSHFGSGILTFNLEYLFRTPPGINLHVRGPANMPKDGIFALEGIVETDWSEATFTMNWKFTRPNHTVVFEADEPIAMLTPVVRGKAETFTAEIRDLDEDSKLAAGYREWANSRSSFNEGLKNDNSVEKKAGWQRHYLSGETVSQTKATSHQTSLTLAEFQDKRSEKKAL